MFGRAVKVVGGAWLQTTVGSILVFSHMVRMIL